MSHDQAPPPALKWTGERYVPEVEGNIRLEHVHRYLIARELSPGKDVLDIACGEGYGSAILADAAAHVVGVDIAGDVITHASARYERPNLEFKQGTATPSRCRTTRSMSWSASRPSSMSIDMSG